MISAKKFIEFLNEIEAKTKWTFSGDVDLVPTNARFNSENDSASLDFTSTIACQLDRMKKDGAIESVASCLEETSCEVDIAWARGKGVDVSRSRKYLSLSLRSRSGRRIVMGGLCCLDRKCSR
jgi:hypothetical protein